MSDSPEEVLAWHSNYVEAISSIARVTPGGVVREAGGLTLARSGLGIPAFNAVFALDPPSSLATAEDGVWKVFGDSATRWLLVTTPEISKGLGPLIRAFDLRHEETIPGMAWAPLPERVPPGPAGFEVRRVRVPEEARLFAQTMMEGFEARPALMDPWVDGVRTQHLTSSELPGWYLGFLSGRPVGTAVRITTGDVAGIYGVSTLPGFRRRGFGEAITRHAAIEGYQEGCRTSYLQSSKAGRSVYERIGFRWVEDYQLWSPARGEGPSVESEQQAGRKG